MLHDPGALGLGDLAGPVRRRRVDHEDLVEERDATHHLADRPADDRTDRLLLVERRQDEADRDALGLLEIGQATQVGELGVMEVRLAEPALDPGRDRAGLLGGSVGGGQRLGLLARAARTCRRPIDSRVLTTTTVGFARVAMASGIAPNSEASPPARGRRRAHDHEIGSLGLAQDRVADVARLAQQRLGAPLHVRLDERGERSLGLGADRQGDPRRDEVEDDDLGPVRATERVREASAPARREDRRGPGRGSAGCRGRRAA